MIFPAIDIQGGQSVRLQQGDFKKRTTIAESPLDQAERYETARVGAMHIVDLDGAKFGKPQHLDLIREMTNQFTGIVQVGGGIRTRETIETYLKAGVSRVIVGSALIHTPEIAEQLLLEYGGDHIVLGIDGKNGRVATDGWLQEGLTTMADVIKQMVSFGAKYAIVTDIAKDGMMAGPNIELLGNLQSQFPNVHIIASGGIRHMTDVKALQEVQVKDMIVGKALHQGGFTLEEIRQYNGN